MTVSIGGLQVARVGATVAGGVIIGPGAPTVSIGGLLISLNGDGVASHGAYQHASATMIASHNNTVTISGTLIIVDTDSATCGDIANG